MADPEQINCMRVIREMVSSIDQHTSAITNNAVYLTRMANHYQAALGCVSDAWTTFVDTDDMEPIVDAIKEMRDTMRQFGQEP